MGKTPEARRMRRWLNLLIVAVLLAGLFWVIPIQDVVRALFQADPMDFFIALLLAVVATLLTAAELEPLTRHQGIRHGMLEIMAVNMAVRFYMVFMPSSIVAGGIRWYRLSQPGDKGTGAFVALVFFRLVETFLALVLGLGFWLLSAHKAAQVSAAWLTFLIVGTLAVWFLLTRLSLPILYWLKPRLVWAWRHPLLLPILLRLEKLLEGVAAYAALPARDLLMVLISGVVSLLVGIFSNMFLARSLGIQLSFLDMGWLNSVVSLVTQLPVTVAGGFGVREVTVVAILTTYGVAADLALAFSLLIFARGVTLGLAGGLIEGLRLLRAGRQVV